MGSDENKNDNSTFYSGMGKLSDLVELYSLKGNQLFDECLDCFFMVRKMKQRVPLGKSRKPLI